jgi:hypothetical protein
MRTRPRIVIELFGHHSLLSARSTEVKVRIMLFYEYAGAEFREASKSSFGEYWPGPGTIGPIFSCFDLKLNLGPSKTDFESYVPGPGVGGTYC